MSFVGTTRESVQLLIVRFAAAAVVGRPQRLPQAVPRHPVRLPASPTALAVAQVGRRRLATPCGTGVCSADNVPVPAYWTVDRIANRVHRLVLAPSGFTRRGRVCERLDGGLRRTLSFHTRSTEGPPQVQLVAKVALIGLPPPITECRYDSLSGTATTEAGHHFYTLPASDQDPPPDLLADSSGPILEFLLQAGGLGEFVLWAQEVFAGDLHPGWWHRYQPVVPQGTGPLQAAAFAAAALPDTELVQFLATRVENEEPSEQCFDDFLKEIRQVQPDVRQRHPITRPVRW